VTVVKEACATPCFVPGATQCDTREAVDVSSQNMPKGMTRECVEREKGDVNQQDKRSETNPWSAIKPKSADGVVPENHKKDQR